MMRRAPPMWRRAPSGALASLVWLGAGAATARQASAAPATPTAAAVEVRADDARVVELNERGSALYGGGDYRRAVELFLQAYAIDGDPNLLFNIAACYEGLGDPDAAIEKYRAFLADPSADSDGRPRAEGAIARLLASETAPAQPSPPEPVAAAPPAATVAPAPTQVDLGPESEPLPEWLPWAVLGGGAALGVAGVSVYLMGVADHREVTEASGYDDPNAVVHSSRSRAEALVDSGNSKKVIGASSAALGGALIAGYVVWRVLERPDELPAASRVDVSVSPSAASLSWAGRF